MSPWPQTVLIGLATGACTGLGGWLALSLRRGASLLQGFSQGAVIGVATFELLPEAVRSSGPSAPPALVVLCAAVGLLGAAAAGRAISDLPLGRSGRNGHRGAGTLTLHSAMDGLAIGIAFQSSPVIGLSVAGAVMAHDIADGMNTVSIGVEN